MGTITAAAFGEGGGTVSAAHTEAESINAAGSMAMRALAQRTRSLGVLVT